MTLRRYCFLEDTIRLAGDGKGSAPARLLISTTKKIVRGEGDVMQFSEKDLFNIKKNFDDNALGRDIPIIYDHSMSGFSGQTRAAGWIGGIELEKGADGVDRLFATGIRWTKEGQSDVVSGAYRYLSVGVYLDHTDIKDDKKKIGMTLFEISLTNNPADHNLGEIGQLSKLFKEFSMEPPTDKDTDKKEEDLKNKAEDKKKESTEETIARLKAEIASREKEVKKFSEKFYKEKEKTMSLEKKVSEDEKKAELDKLLSEGKIAPFQRDEGLKLSGDEYKGFLTFARSNKAVSVAPTGKTSTADADKTTLTQDQRDEKVVTLAKKIEKDEGLAYSDAIVKAHIEINGNN